MKKKKAGILTFHDADNLGAVLQAYALQNTLEDICGVDAEIIDYRCEKISATKRAKKSGGIKGFLKYIIMSAYYTVKRHGFDSFRKEHLRLSDKVYVKDNVSECKNNYDYFICGSDQVWNPQCTDGDTTYLLDFVDENSKKYSYAASIGNCKFSNADAEWLKLIDEFSRISVREESAAKQLQDFGIKNAAVHPDPVFLLSDEQWKRVMSKRLTDKKYVLVYLVLPDVNVMKAAEEYAEKNGLKLISNKQSAEFILHNSPSEFLSWIFNAECVFTNSFHGSAFSLIMKKKLYADIRMQNGETNTRVSELLDKVGCGKNKLSVTDCGRAVSAVDTMRETAREYLETFKNA